MKHWKALVISLAVSLGAGGLAALLTRNSMELYRQLNQPSLAPPGWVFPVVWTILFALMGISAWMVWRQRPSPLRSRALLVYILQLAVNVSWSLVFFGAHRFWWAMAVLILLECLIFWMLLLFARVYKPAARLQVPYFLWVLFAGYLNFMVAVLNP